MTSDPLRKPPRPWRPRPPHVRQGGLRPRSPLDTLTLCLGTTVFGLRGLPAPERPLPTRFGAS